MPLFYSKTYVWMLMLFFSVVGFSQKTFDIGFKTGLHFPNTRSGLSDFAKLYSDNKKTTATLGILSSYQVKKWFCIKTEVFYEERGWVIPNSSALDTVILMIVPTKRDYFYSFITVPILAQFSIGNKVQAFLNTGINMSRRIDGKIKTTTPNTIGSATSVLQPSVIDPKFDFGLVASVGSRLSFQSLFLELEARYYRSISPIGKILVEDQIHHHGFIFSGGIGYTFGKK